MDEVDIRKLAELVARLSANQQRVVATVAEGFRSGWLDPASWEHAWRDCDLTDDWVLADALTWLARRKRRRARAQITTSGAGA
ncbi:MAG TPA: hypothetical protein VF995_00120 [Actinomycetota bacterium]